MQERPFAISIAGFDPSQGAGVGADLKTFEQFGVQGLGVCTALTYQTENSFDGLDWVEPEKVFRQFKVLADRYPFEHAKIGLIQSFDVLEWFIGRAMELRPELKIVWDPVLSASAGFDFHEAEVKSTTIKSKRRFAQWAKMLEMITPNADEAAVLTNDKNPDSAGEFLSTLTNTWVKSAVNIGDSIIDHLYIDGVLFELSQNKLDLSKHGTGCILSAATAAGMANGKSLYASSIDAHAYLNAYLQSSNTRLGHHKELIVG